nr:MAG TPA: hypothetical protein [Caudoviricetes sp.]
MEQFKQIYRILSILHKAMDLEEWDSKLLSPEALGITFLCGLGLWPCSLKRDTLPEGKLGSPLT